MTIDKEHVWATLRGLLRSLTAWVSVLLAALPEIIPLVQANFPTVSPFIPDGLHSRVLQLLALVMLVLRMKTNTSLADKGRSPAKAEWLREGKEIEDSQRGD